MLLEEPVVTRQPPTGEAPTATADVNNDTSHVIDAHVDDHVAPDVAVNDDHNEEHAAVLGEGKSIYSYGHFLTQELIFSRVIDLCAKEHG